MKKSTKIVWLIAVFALLCLITVPSQKVFAYVDRDGNSSSGNATNIPLNGTVSDNILEYNTTDGNDIDWFCFTISEAGYVTINFSHQKFTSDDLYWEMYIYKDDGSTSFYDYYDVYYPIYGNDDGITTAKLGLNPGVYKIKVNQGNLSWSPSAYSITVNFTKDSFFESESNYNSTKADAIAVNQLYAASIYRSADVDWYKFDLPESGYISIDFSHPEMNNNNMYWQMYLFTSDAKSYVTGNSHHWDIYGDSNLSTEKYGLPAGTYYLKITSGPLSNSDVDYKFKVNFTSDANWETEKNEGSEFADKIDVNKAISGTIAPDDVDDDWYYFDTSGDGVVSIDFSHPNIGEARNYWRLYLYKSDAKSYVTDNSQVWNVLGNGDLTTEQFGLPAGRYYIKVENGSLSSSSEVYKLTVNYTASSNWETESNEKKELADELLLNKTYNATIAPEGSDADWFFFKLSQAGYVTIEHNHNLIDSSYVYYRLYAYQSDGNTKLFSDERFSICGNENFKSDEVYLSAATYYVRITEGSMRSTSEPYEIRVNYSTQPGGSGSGSGSGSGGESGSTSDEYVEFSGNLDGNNMSDSNEISPENSSSITIDVTADTDKPADVDLKVSLVDEKGNEINSSDLSFDNGKDCFSGTVTADTGAGNYYAKIENMGASANVSYNMNIYINKKYKSAGWIYYADVYVAQDSPEIIAIMDVDKSRKNDDLEFRWVACEESDPNTWFEVSPWTKNNPYLCWTPDKAGNYIVVGFVRVVGNEKDSQQYVRFGVVYRKSRILDICQMPYWGPGDGYLIGFESSDNPNQEYYYEMFVMDLELYELGWMYPWVHATGKIKLSEGKTLWTIWQPEYGYYLTLFRLYDKDGNMLDEKAYGFVNAN